MTYEQNAIDFLARGGGAPCCVRGEILVKAFDEVRAERDRLRDTDRERNKERPRG